MIARVAWDPRTPLVDRRFPPTTWLGTRHDPGSVQQSRLWPSAPAVEITQLLQQGVAFQKGHISHPVIWRRGY